MEENYKTTRANNLYIRPSEGGEIRIVNQSVTSDGAHSSVITEYNDGTVTTKVTGPSEQSVVNFEKGKISTKQLNITNVKDAN